MAILVVLFLDLASLPVAKGDDALYRQAMSDHKLHGSYSAGSADECRWVAQGFPKPEYDAGTAYDAANQGKRVGPAAIKFSNVGWWFELAFFQLTTSDATSCLLYRKSGASYRLVREIRLPH